MNFSLPVLGLCLAAGLVWPATPRPATGGVEGTIGWNVLLGCRGGSARGAGEPDEIAGAPV